MWTALTGIAAVLLAVLGIGEWGGRLRKALIVLLALLAAVGAFQASRQMERLEAELQQLRADVAKGQEFNRGQTTVIAQLSGRALELLDEARRGQSAKPQELEQLQRELAEARRFQPRHLTDQQKAVLQEKLSPFPGTLALTLTFAIETRNYAEELRETFEKSGWTILGRNQIGDTRFPTGITVVAAPQNTDVDHLRDALQAAGVDAHFSFSFDHRKDMISFSVGDHPFKE